MCFQILWFSDGLKAIFGMDKILLCINSAIRPHLTVRPCKATLRPMFSFHHVWSSSWQNCQSLLCLLLIASSSFLVLCFTLDILCPETLLREQCKASVAKQSHYFRLLIPTRPLCCRSFENDEKNHYLILASPMTEPPIQVLDLVNSYGLSDSPCYLSFLPFSPLLLRESLFSHENVTLLKKFIFDSIIDGVLCFSSDIFLGKALTVRDLRSVTHLVILSNVWLWRIKRI